MQGWPVIFLLNFKAEFQAGKQSTFDHTIT